MFVGSFVALVTPFTLDGKIDFPALEQLIAWHLEEGTDGIVCCGTTGEGVVLSDTEKKAIAETCIQVIQKKIPLIVSTGTSDTQQTVRLTEMAKQVGADGCLVVTPYYNRPSQRGCLIHYQKIAEVGLPMIVYHNPLRAAVHLELTTIQELSNIPEIVAIKESSGSLELLRSICTTTKLTVLSGEDHLTLASLGLGAQGAISVIGNIVPRLWKRMIHEGLSGDIDIATNIAKSLEPLRKALFLETNPQCVKYALKLLKKSNGILRLPLVIPEKKHQRILRQSVEEMSIFEKVFV